MKIRTDFVTNSSSSSFCCWKVESKELAEYVKGFLLNNGGYSSIEITVDGDTVIGANRENGSSIDEVYDFAYDSGYDDEDVSYSSYSDNDKENGKERDQIVESIIDDFRLAIFEEPKSLIYGIFSPYSAWDMNTIKEIMSKPETKIVSFESADAFFD